VPALRMMLLGREHGPDGAVASGHLVATEP
jgi:hypothetical protein